MIMARRLRKFALAAHLAFAVGWIGAVAGYIALDVAAATSQDAQMLRAGYLAMELTAWYVIVPLALASLLTGLVMSLGTKWGLFRHYWVLISLLLTIIATVVLLVVGLMIIGGGEHGPGRHTSSGDAGGQVAASSTMDDHVPLEGGRG